MSNILDGYTAEVLMRSQAIDVSNLEKEINPKMVGWICPVCGRGLSPYTLVCPCKETGKGYEVTC